MSEALSFLKTMFEYKPAEAYVLVWAAEGSRSFWFRELGEAAKQVEALRRRCNVYFQVALSPKSFGPGNRCKADDTLGIPGLWLDLDFGTVGHKKGNLPPTEEDVLSLLAEAQLPPTLIVHSGHGLQPYWLFKEPWLFSTPAEREEAARLVRAWERTFRVLAARHGWDVDTTHDLARVLRMPGSVNHKGDPVPVHVFRNGGPRCDPADFVDYLLAGEEGRPKVGEVPVVALCPEAKPPWEKLRALETSTERFRLTLARKRKDLQDKSPSAYDYSIAGFAIWDGWSDQEITDTIIWSRAQNDEDVPKALRADYIPRILAKLRAEVQHEEAVTTLEELYADDAEQKPTRYELAVLLQQALLIDIVRITKYLGEEPQFLLHTEEGAVKLGDIDGLIAQGKLRKAIAKQFRKYIPEFKSGRWRIIAQALLDFCREEDPGPEATDAGLLEYWLDNYLTDHEPIPALSPQLLKEGLPFKKEDGSIWISAGNFLDFLGRRHNERRSLRELCQMLKRYGATRNSEDLRSPGNRTSRSVWQLPEQEYSEVRGQE